MKILRNRVVEDTVFREFLERITLINESTDVGIWAN